MSSLGHDPTPDTPPGGHPASGLATGVSGRRFHIHACLGRGGFGEVYRATMMSAGGVRTEVAIKILRADIDPGSDSVKRLRDEGRLLGALSHPSILRVHDLVLLQGRVALVTEFVEGEDLDSCLAQEEAFPVRCLVSVVGDVASALDVAWNAPSPGGPGAGGPMHLVHRDVKPANVRLGRHGEVKLLDFGIARATNVDREAQTATNAMLGSYLYMAPERFHEEKVEPPSDVYAVGCILYEGLTKHRLFEGMTLKQIYGTMLLSRKFNSHVEERLQRVPSETPPAVMDLLRSLLEVDPGNRPTAGQVARIAEDLAETLPGTTLKRWARAREWAPQAQTTGTLDGCEIEADSFDVSDRDRSKTSAPPAPPPLTTPPPVRAPDPPRLTMPTPSLAPPAPEADPEPPAAVAAPESAAPPAPPATNAAASPPEPPLGTARPSPPPAAAPPAPPVATPRPTLGAPLGRMIGLPSPDGADGLDAPVAGLISREMARFTPEEMAEAKAEAERSLAPGAAKPVPIAPSGPRPTPPPAMARQVAPPVPPPVASPAWTGRSVPSAPPPPPPPPSRPVRAAPAPAPSTLLPDPSPTPTAGPPVRAARPQPIRLPEPSITAPSPRSGSAEGAVGALTESWFESTPAPAEPRPVEGEIPDAPEPIPGLLDEEPVVRTRLEVARRRRDDDEQRQRRALYAILAVTSIGLLALAVLGYWVFGQIATQLQARADAEGLEPGAQVAAVQPEPSEPAAEAPVPDPARAEEGPSEGSLESADAPLLSAPPEAQRAAPPRPAPAPAPKPAPAPPPAPAAKVAPAPAPAPAPPTPAAEPKSPAATKQAIDRAWARVDERPGEALAQFDKVLAKEPKNHEALYGRGYALLKLDRTSDAVDVLCRVKRMSKGPLEREINGILLSEKLSCP